MIDLNPVHLAIVTDILAEHVPTYEVRAFGSRATWTAKDHSDLDLVIIGDEPLPTNTLSCLREALEESPLPIRVDVLDWHTVPESWQEGIDEDCEVVQEVIAHNKWQKTTFGECAYLVRDTVSPSDFDNTPYIGLEHIGEGTLSLIGSGIANDVSSAKLLFQCNDILFGKLRPYFRKLARPQFGGICSTDIWVVRPTDQVDIGFLFYLMASSNFVDTATRGSEGTRMPRAKWDFVSQLPIWLPPLDEQRRIAHILSTLDDRIELNRRMSKTLEEMAQALFRSWFVNFDPVHAKVEGRPSGLPPDLDTLFPSSFQESQLGPIPKGWKVKSLDEIAVFTNGLALQRFPPHDDDWLPVIKIAEMKRGYSQNTSKASASIDPKYIVEDSDLLFSWSGSLEIVLWANGQGALNQHLFKVTSCEFPLWFYRGWIANYLEHFRQIAASKATTMGHIQRHHLTDTKVVIPPQDTVFKSNRYLATLTEQEVRTAVQARTLAAQRDKLLPPLVSGKLRTWRAK